MHQNGRALSSTGGTVKEESSFGGQLLNGYSQPERDGRKIIKIRLTCGQYFVPPLRKNQLSKGSTKQTTSHLSGFFFCFCYFQRGGLHLKSTVIIESEMWQCPRKRRNVWAPGNSKFKISLSFRSTHTHPFWNRSGLSSLTGACLWLSLGLIVLVSGQKPQSRM